MTVFVGVDPGPDKSAVVAIDGEGTVLHAEELANAAALARLVSFAGDGAVIGIEDMRSYGMPVGRSILDTAWWCGRFWQAIRGSGHGATAARVPRKAVVATLCGNARAGDSGVRDALLDMYPGGKGTRASPGPLHKITGHKWAALAVARHLLETHDGQATGGAS